MNEHATILVIGLETHVQLATRTKLFCGCSTQFGMPPNTQTCPVCLGLPGALPVLNAHAFELALRTAVALRCQIPPITRWDRKQYYYPDLPKGYQISQFDQPLSQHGSLAIADPKNPIDPKSIRILRAHLEEDAGKSMHDEQAGRQDSRIDLNRTGTPLLEIVTEPDLRSAAEAKAYLTELKLLLTYLGVSDCNMQEGSLRVDANVNLHIESESGMVATPIVEVKNMNSFRAVERALLFEAKRQYEQWQATGLRKGDVPKQTRGWDDEAQVTHPLRAKEESSDYRYFPDPDLVPVRIPTERVAALRKSLGELPSELRARLSADYSLPTADADVLVQQGRGVVDYFERAAELSGQPRQAGNWVLREVLRHLNETGTAIHEFPVAAGELAVLLRAVRDGQVDSPRAKEVFQFMLQQAATCEQACAALGITRLDSDELLSLCRSLLAANPRIVDDVKRGNLKAVGALIGQAKRQNPNIHPAQLQALCLQLIDQLP